MSGVHMQGNITLENYNQVLSNVSGAVRGAATSEKEQTTSNLTVVAAAFERSAAQLANRETSVPNTVSSLIYLGMYLVSCMPRGTSQASQISQAITVKQ